MMRAAERRWPIESAVRALELSGMSKALVGEMARVNPSTWTQELLSDHQADRIAIALGVHPVFLWPEWFDVALSVMCECGTERIYRGDRFVCLPCDARRNRENRRLKVSAA